MLKSGISKNFLFDGVFLFALGAAVFFFCSHILKFWWLADDPAILKHAVQYSFFEYFFNPSVWRELSISNLTPWLTLAYDIDWHLFGLKPESFYLHHLSSIVLGIFVLYVGLRHFFPPFLAFLASLLFLCSLPFFDVSQHLYKRHYLDGLIFSCISFIFFVHAIKKDKMELGLLAAFFYALALTAKEIYAPLCLFFLMIPEVDLKRRIRHLFPVAAVAIVYIIWRRLMLGEFLGGYGQAVSLPSLHEFFMFFQNIFLDLNYTEAAQYVIFIALMSAGGACFLKCSFQWKLFWICWALIVLLPVAPVLSLCHSHYMLLPYLFTSVAAISVTYWITVTYADSKSALMIYALPLMLVIINIGLVVPQAAAEKKNAMERIYAEGEFVLKRGARTDILLSPAMPFWHHHGLLWLREEVLGSGAGPEIFADECFLNYSAKNTLGYNRKIYKYDRGLSEVAPVKRLKKCDIRKEADLYVRFAHNDRYKYLWQLGPYDAGSYKFLIRNQKTGRLEIVYPVAQSGRLKASFNDESVYELIVKYASNQGWMTYSDAIPFNSGKEFSIEWSR
ncbi:MAG: hypothetical protein U5L07_14955 [Desulfobacterales bacterium]|nr:hypothetical protein [Desulfobacterales bacterium]